MSLPIESQKRAEALLKTDWTTLSVISPTTKPTEIHLPTSTLPLSTDEQHALQTLFTSREHALRSGIQLRGSHYDVHNWETISGVRLVYGRRGDAVSGVGACIAIPDGTNSDMLVIITYQLPSVSANAVAKLVPFVRTLVDEHMRMDKKNGM